MRLLADSSGVTAVDLSVIFVLFYNLGTHPLASAVIPELVEPDALGHLRPHECRVHDADNDALVLEIETQEF